MIKPWKLLETKYILDNKWIRLSSRRFLLPNGTMIPDYYIVEKPDVVIIVPIAPDGQTIIIREFERGIMDIGYKFPAGRINKDESPLDAAKREFSEETHVGIDRITEIGLLDADPGWLTIRAYVFIAEVSDKITKPSRDPKELYEMEWMDFNLFGNMIRMGEVHNIFVVAAYHFAENYIHKSLVK